MKRKSLFILLSAMLMTLLTACSSNDSSGDSIEEGRMEHSTSNDMGMYHALEEESEEVARDDQKDYKDSGEISTNRMIIHQAQLQLNVKNFEEAQLNIEKKVSIYGGYIVESNVYRENEGLVYGTMTVRVPEKDFKNFITDTEGEASDILERNITGQDVTEQYVDLESRLKSKRVVEERLLEFMGNAEKTEDLLKISSDLSAVQEEIELIVGKMKYLENQTSFSTIEITMYENRVIVPELDSNDLDTWNKTKKQFATSTNFLLAAGSGLIVFVIGNIPIIILFALIGLAIYIFVRKNRSVNKDRREGN